MTRDKALSIILRIQEDMGERLLETLTYMYDNLADFDYEEQVAFRIVYRDFRKMFQPKGGYDNDESVGVDCV